MARGTRWAGFACALLALCCVAPSARGQSASPSREQSALAEDQALLQRQLQRLRQTMEVLAQRFETEGRAHAAKLLREGLAHLDERAAEQGAKTIEELMSASQSSIEADARAQAFEAQQAAIRGLERLYAILTDRQGLESLERALDELKRLQKDLGELVDREQRLEQDTAQLERAAATPEQAALEAAIERALAQQRELLARTESEGRASNDLELEAIERALEQLIERQRTDRDVAAIWRPEEKPTLEKSRPALAQASESASRAARLSQAAAELRKAAQETRKSGADLAALQRELERSAEREGRHQRASGDPAAARAAEAFQGAREDVEKASSKAISPEEAARSIEARAADLARAAAEEAAAARAAQSEAQAALAPLRDPKTAAGRIAEDIRKALAKSAPESAEKSGAASEKGLAKGSEPQPDPASAATPATTPAEEERSTAETIQSSAAAARALEQGLDDLRTLKQALSASQSAAAEEAQRLARGLESLDPQGATPPGAQARNELERAAGAMREAAESAAEEHAARAAEEAGKAEQSLQAARAALARAREENTRSRAQGAAARETEQAQAKLADELEKVAEQAESSALSEPARSDAEQGISGAQQAMRKAAQSLSKGESSSASRSQSEAIEELEKAREAARKGADVTRPEDRARAAKLAEEQERIRQKLLELAQRNQKRETAAPSTSLEEAEQSASEARESLDEGELAQAREEEQETERQMREAQKELGAEEEQYQRLRQEELLFKIAEQVKSLIEEHQREMQATLEVDAQRKPGDRANHTQRLRLRKIAKGEESLGTRASEIGTAIQAEESVVFAEVLDQASRDLARLGRELGETGGYQSGERVQALQQDVAESLAWLSEALQEEKERRRQQQQEGQPPQSRPPGENRLVPDVAELKLLRRLEVETLDGLEKLRIVHPELAGPEHALAALDPLVLEDIERLAHRHQRTSDLFEKFRRRLGLPDPGPEGQ